MCGIAGFVNPPNKKVSPSIIKKMNKTIIHRGPDDSGEKIIGNVALANHRLAVIDLSKEGHQPMTNSFKDIWITYNGEIYNFQELKNDLLKKGYKFKSTSDTEVIINLYRAYGVRAIEKLHGMFAFAIWDKRRKQLVLARDHFGIKPLHYFLENNLLIFGSEIKSILAHPAIGKEIDLKALSCFFSIGFGAIPSPFTIFKNIKKLPPACYAIFKDGKLTIKKYWYLENVKTIKISEDEAKEELLRLLGKSIKAQLISDVPLGAFLSGGIDSSLVVALMSKYHSKPPKTFTIGFKDPKFDESRYADKTATHFETNHHVKIFKAKDLLTSFSEVTKKLDEPLGDASILPTYLLSKFTREYVTVSLSGDGGDELFAGYPTYIAHRLNEMFGFIPAGFLKIFPNLEFINKISLVKHSPNLPFAYKLERLLSGWNKNLVERHLNFMGPIQLLVKPTLFTLEVNREVGKDDPATAWAYKIFQRPKSFDRQKLLQFFDFYSYLSEDGLVKTDRASSFNSLEVRVPFLVPEIVEFAFSLPSALKMRGFRLKYILKKAAAEILPDEIFNRPKKGFGIPTHTLLRTFFKRDLREKLSKNRLVKQRIFNCEFVNKLVKEHLENKKDHRMILWNLFIFQYWYDNFFKN